MDCDLGCCDADCCPNACDGIECCADCCPCGSGRSSRGSCWCCLLILTLVVVAACFYFQWKADNKAKPPSPVPIEKQEKQPWYKFWKKKE